MNDLEYFRSTLSTSFERVIRECILAGVTLEPNSVHVHAPCRAMEDNVLLDQSGICSKSVVLRTCEVLIDRIVGVLSLEKKLSRAFSCSPLELVKRTA
jgi:hypothetical protein